MAISSQNLSLTWTWTISTAHITEETSVDLARKLSDHEKVTSDLVCYAHDYGWFISIPSYNVRQSFPENFPKELLNILKIALENKVCWLNLDRDAGIEESLPKFDW